MRISADGPSSESALKLARRLDVERAAYHELLASVEELCRKGALAGEGEATLFVDGMANLIGADLDRDRLRGMLAAVEAKQRLIELLTAYVDGRQQEVRVVVGLGEASPALAGSCPHRLAGTARQCESGNRRLDRAHSNAIPGDDPRRALHCAAF